MRTHSIPEETVFTHGKTLFHSISPEENMTVVRLLGRIKRSPFLFVSFFLFFFFSVKKLYDLLKMREDAVRS